ncbi:hypothetical protein evm_010922 [Chilo suppressalis]|nr:hypothetical protein evm_010922 [Chilo suppressalis]
MCRFVLFVISLVFASTVAPLPGTNKVYRSDYVYNRKADAFYKFHTETLSSTEASSVCQVEGSVLMTPSSHYDIEQLHGMVKQFPDIGDKVWVSSDGEEHESDEEPAIIDLEPRPDRFSSQFDRTCEVVTRHGKIEATYCSRRLPFICKVPARDAPYNSECGVYSKGYIKGQNVSSCYKIPRIAYTWNQAYAECQAQGAHLVVLNSQAESDAVFEIMKNDAKIEGAHFWWFFFAGFRAEVPTDGSPRVFKTIFNETLEEAGYSTWAENEPNNALNNENCGSIFKNDGKLNDVSCTHLYGFICEKEITHK